MDGMMIELIMQHVEEEEGWPLGLQPLNVRVVGVGGGGGGINRARDYHGSMSFNNTLLSASPPTSSTNSSSDLDTESTGSFFHDRSITLGSLIGVSSILNLSRRSIRGRTSAEPSKAKKPCKSSRAWFFSLCSRDSSTDVVKEPNNNPPSLGHFLAVERRSATSTTTTNNSHVRHQGYNDNSYAVPDEFSMATQSSQEMNSLFVNGSVAPPNRHQDDQDQHCNRDDNDQSSLGGNRNRSLEHGIPVLFLCNCSN